MMVGTGGRINTNLLRFVQAQNNSKNSARHENLLGVSRRLRHAVRRPQPCFLVNLEIRVGGIVDVALLMWVVKRSAGWRPNECRGVLDVCVDVRLSLEYEAIQSPQTSNRDAAEQSAIGVLLETRVKHKLFPQTQQRAIDNTE